MEFSDGLGFEEFTKYLSAKGLHEDVVSVIFGSRINGELFLSLSEGDLKELGPAIGDRLRLRKILEEARKVCNCFNLFINFITRANYVCDESRENDSSITESTPSVSPAVTPSHAHTRNIEASSMEISSSEWHISFLIPELQIFSHHVKDAIATGIIPGRARREIIQVLRTYMTAHTIKPNSEQYNTICKKLILKYPKLSDTKGKTKYVSMHTLIIGRF